MFIAINLNNDTDILFECNFIASWVLSFGDSSFAVHWLSIHVCMYLLAEYVSGLTLQENKKTDQGMWTVWLWVRRYLRECVSASMNDKSKCHFPLNWSYYEIVLADYYTTCMFSNTSEQQKCLWQMIRRMICQDSGYILQNMTVSIIQSTIFIFLKTDAAD